MNTADKDTLTQELDALLEELGPELVWRPCRDTRGKLVTCGQGHAEDGLPEELEHNPALVPDVDFTGKRVADLGCNAGHFTFLAARCGAELTTGVDIDPRMIRACKLQRMLGGPENTAFHTRNLLEDPPVGRFDLVMLIDVIGKRLFASGLAKGLLDSVEAHADDGPNAELLVSVRPWYKIRRHLHTTPETLAALYGEKYVRADRFLAMKFIIDRFREQWRGRRVWPFPSEDEDRMTKYLLLFTRRKGESS